MANNNADIDLIATLNESSSEAEILKAIKILNGRLKTNANAKIKLAGELDTKAIQAELNRLETLLKSKTQNSANINIKGKVDNKEITSSVQKATKDAQSVANKNAIQVSINLKKDKLINDIKVFGQQNTKLFKDADMTAKYNSLLDNAKLATSSKEIKNLRLQLSAMRSEIKATNLSGLTLGDTFKKTFKRAVELFTGTGGAMLLAQQLRSAWTEAMNLDSAYTDLVKVQDELSRSDYLEYLEECNKKAQELASTQQALIEGATEFSKSGYNLTTSDALTEKSTILANVGDMSASDSAKAIISGVQTYDIIDGYDDVVDKAQALIDKYNEIGNTASITTAEIAEGVQSVGSVFADANTSVDEFISLLAAGNREYQDADSLALGLRTSALRIRSCTSELETMGEETDTVVTSTAKLEEKIKALTNINGSGGVEILESDGETFRSIYDIYVDIAKVYQDMSDTDQSALLDLIAGKNRASAIGATLNNMSEAQEIYQRSLESAGSAQEEYNIYLESSEASLNRFKSSMTETYQSVISGETVTGLLNCGNATLQFVNSLGLVESSLKGIIAIGIVKAVTALSTAFKASAIQASNFGTALNTVKNMSSMTRGTTEYTNALKTLKTISAGLSDTQLKQVLASKALSDSDRIAILRTTGLTKAQAQAKLAQMGLTQSTKAQTTANASATASTFSLTAAVKGFGVSLKAAFMSNPVGISIMALSTIIGAVSSKVSEYNEKLRETRQANMDAATSAKEKTDSLRDLYVQYENLNSITNRTSSQEEQFKQVVIDITKALGDKASALEGLTAGTDEYTASLKEATKAELESQYATAKIGAKAAEEELKDKTYDSWSGSQITIQQNEQMTGVKEHVAALEAVKDILAEYEDMGTYGIEWEPVNWDSNKDDMNAVVEYYNALIEARNKLATADNADFLMSSDIYEDINNTINDLSESVEKYTEQQYNALKLNYEWQNGVPSTEEEFHKMEESILDASGAGQEFQEVLKGYLAEDFSTFSNSVSNIDEVTESTKALNEEVSILSEDRLAELEEQADNLNSIINEIQSSYDTLQSAIEEYNTQGYLSLDTLESLMALDSDYLACLVNENGQLSLNQDAMNALAQAKLDEAEASAVAQAMTELNAIANGEAASSTVNYISGNASLMQSLALLAGQYDNVANAAMTAAQAQELSAMIEAANAKDSVATARVMSGLNSRLGLIRSTSSSIRTRGIGGYGSKKSSGSSSSKDAWKEEFDAQYDLLKHNLEMEYITEEQYYTALNALNEKYFANNAKYTDEYRKYQEEVYKGLQKVYKDYIENNMSYLEKALDANRISFGHYSNAVKKMLDDMWHEGKISASDYWSYVEKMLEKQLDIYDSVINAATTLLQEELDKIQDEIDLLEDKNDALQKQLDDYDGILSAVDKVYQDEIDRLQDEKDLLQDKINAINDANDALDLQYRKEQAIIALKRAQDQRNKKLFNGKEFIFTTDQDAIRDAQEELQDIETEELISRLEDEQEIIQNSIDVLEEYRQKWQEITDCYDTELNRQLAIMLFGENYENRILQNRIEDIESFKNDYISIQAQIDDNQSMIDSYNEKIEYYQNLKDQWSAISEAYEKERDRQYAAQVLGAQWEQDVLNGRISTLTNFKNEYVALQQAIADAAVASANAVIQANQNAANSIASTPTSIPSGGGGGSSSGGSGGTTTTTPTPTAPVWSVIQNGTNAGLYSGTKAECTRYIERNNYSIVREESTHHRIYVTPRGNTRPNSNVNRNMAYASGTTNAKKGLNLVGEAGTETYIDNDGNVSLVTAPSLIEMEGGETVKNAKETQDLLNPDNLVPVEMMELPGINGKILKLSTDEFMDKVASVMPNYSSMVQSAIQMPKYDFTPVQNNSTPVVQNINLTLPNVTNNSGYERIAKELKQAQLDALQVAYKR